MKGNNTLILNMATMAEAVQEYLHKRMLGNAPKVVSVKAASNSTYDSTFTVELEEQPVTQKPEHS